MANVVMGKNLVKKSIFINKYGQEQEGSIYQNYQENHRNNPSGLPTANRLREDEGKTEAQENK